MTDMREDEIRPAVRSFLLQGFLPGEAPGTLDDTTKLISSGIVPSLSLIELVTFIESTFPVTLRVEDIGVSRMNSVDDIVKLVLERASSSAEKSETAE
jgi:acyl carrier protein